jgi:Protein of unknown function (DUF2757)
MALHYSCRHCGTSLGKLEQSIVNSEQLGFHMLNDEERKDFITYTSNGDIHVKSICSDCQEALERNPDLHSIDYLIQ